MHRPNLRTIVPMMVVLSLISGMSALFQLMGATALPATVIYPLVTGGSVILSAAAGVIALGDKLTGQ